MSHYNSMDTAVHHLASVLTPSHMSDADWKPIWTLNKIKLSWSPRSLLDQFKLSPVTVKRVMGVLEHNHANHLRWERQLPEVREKMIEDGEIEAPIPCKYVKVNTEVFNKLRGYQYVDGKLVPTKEDKRVDIVAKYDGDAKPDYQPEPMKPTMNKLGYEKAFYDAVGLSEEQHRFPVVDEHRDEDSVATMVYDHKTGGEVTMVNRNVAKRTRRRNYGTCLSTISPYRS